MTIPDEHLASLQAAREAILRSDYTEAQASLEAGLALAAALDEAARRPFLTDIHEQRGRVYRLQGLYDRASGEFEAMQACASTPARALDARMYIGDILSLRGQYDEAVALFQEAQERATQLGHQAAVALANYELGSIAHRRGDTDQAVRHLERAWGLYRALNDGEAQQRSLVMLGHARARRGEYDKAIRHHEEALRLALATGNKLPAAIQLNNLGECYQRLGDMAAALDYHQRSLRIREEHDLPISADLIRNLGVDLLGLERPVEALAQLRQALEMAHRQGDKDYIMQAHASLGEALLACGELDEAVAVAQELLDDATVLQAPYFRARALLIIGRIHLARGDRARAYRLLEEGHCVAQAAHSYELLWQLHAYLGEAAAAPALADVHDRIAAEWVVEVAALLKDEELKQRFLDSPRARRVLTRVQAKGIKLVTRRLGRL